MSELLSHPDESKFNAMETVAVAQGPEAEARRREMSQWSESQGQYAETANRVNKSAEDNAKSMNLSPEDTLNRINEANKRVADLGVPAEQGTKVRIKATEQGIVRELDGSNKLLRSPAHIKNSPELEKDQSLAKTA